MMRMKQKQNFPEDPDEIIVESIDKEEMEMIKSNRQRRSSSPFHRRDSFNRKMVSLLVIDGCEKCRDRMEKEKEEQFDQDGLKRVSEKKRRSY